MRLMKAVWPMVLMFGASSVSADTFTLAVEPAYPSDQVQEVYRPLAEYLAKSTGHSFKIVSPRNYHFYWRDIRQNAAVDFVFEEAHFTEFRARRFGFTPLVRKIEPSSYAIIADPEYSERGLDGLVGRRIATMPSPSLGFALLAEFFKNPVSQPEFSSEATSWRDGPEMVFSGDAEAAMVPEYIARQYPNLVEVARSREFIGTTLSASPEVPVEVRDAVREALLRIQDDESSYDVLAEMGASGFEPAAAADYVGAERVLSGFFGYSAATVNAAALER
jgi:ABC-type phosphate/phosphonate transport system substrate-binding protein